MLVSFDIDGTLEAGDPLSSGSCSLLASRGSPNRRYDKAGGDCHPLLHKDGCATKRTTRRALAADGLALNPGQASCLRRGSLPGVLASDCLSDLSYRPSMHLYRLELDQPEHRCTRRGS